MRLNINYALANNLPIKDSQGSLVDYLDQIWKKFFPFVESPSMTQYPLIVTEPIEQGQKQSEVKEECCMEPGVVDAPLPKSQKIRLPKTRVVKAIKEEKKKKELGALLVR